MGFSSGKDKLTNSVEVITTDTQLKLSYDDSNSTTLSVSSGGTLAVLPSGGFASISGMLGYRQYGISTKAHNDTLTAAESGGVIFQATSHGTPGNVVINLPATVAGLLYSFLFVGTPEQGFHISPNSADKIAGSIIDVANGNVVTAANSGAGADNKDLILDTGSKVGDRVTLLGDGSAGWTIVSGLGSWAFES